MDAREDHRRLTDLAAAALTWTGTRPAPADLELDHDEAVYTVVEGVELIDLKTARPPFTGGAAQFSYAVARAMADSAPATRSVDLAEPVRTRDRGRVVVTDQRVVFVGAKLEREWRLPSVTGLTHDSAVPETWLHLSARGNTTGLRYDGAQAVDLRFALHLVLADGAEQRLRFANAVAHQRDAAAPAVPAPVPLPVPVPVPGPATLGARVGRVAKVAYLGKPGVARPLRLLQTAAAVVLTLAVVGAALPSSADDDGDVATEAAVVAPLRVAPEPTADAAAAAAAERLEAERDAAAAAEAETERLVAEAEADRAEADRIAAEQQAAQAAADAAAAEATRAAAEQAAADAAQAQAAQAAAAAEAAEAARVAEAAPAPAASSGSGCTSAYPDFCIPPAGDYDCGDFSEGNFTALAPDPYRLDDDGDGDACESN